MCTSFCAIASTPALLFCTWTLSRPIFDSGFRSKQKLHGCARGIVVMVRTAAIDECRDPEETFVKVQVTLPRGV